MAKKAKGNTTKLVTRSHSVLIPAVVGNDRTSLGPENPRIRGLAFKWRWKVETVIRRVEDALPSKIERMIYVDLAVGYRIHPESLRKLLDIFRGDNHLTASDLEKRSVGLNLVKSKFDDVVDKVEQALLLVDKTSDSASYMMSMESAARLVEVYGDQAEEVLGQIVENVSDVAEYLGISLDRSPSVIVGVAIKTLLEKVNNLQGGKPLPLTVEEMFYREEGERTKGRRWHV